MTDRKFSHGLHRMGEAVKIRETVAQKMKEKSIQNRPKPVEPVDYETYILKNKVVLHNDPQREMLTFPHDDIQIPAPAPPKKSRTVRPTVPNTADKGTSNLLVQECIESYTEPCHMVRFKYRHYSSNYRQLPNVKRPTNLPDQVFEIDKEMDDRDYDDSVSRSFTGSMSAMTGITKEGWLHKGPDSGRDNIISFTRQFKRRFFCVKQQADQTYVMEFFKDDKKHDAKGVIFLDCAQDIVKNTKKGKNCFEVRMPEKVYLFAAESEAEMEDWIHILDKVRTAAETLSQLSVDRSREDLFSPSKMDEKTIENSVHPEMMKYSKESESMLTRARQDGRQNLFSVYSNMVQFLELDEEVDEIPAEVDIFPRTFGERFMLRLLDFKFKLQVNLGDEGHPPKQCNPEPFYLTFALYDVRDGRKISEDFHMDLNEPEIARMIPADALHAADRLHTVEGKDTTPDLNGIDDRWLLSKNRQGIFSVIRRHSEIYLFVKIEKVLQGPISQAVEPYLKGADTKTGSKVYRQMKQFCSHIGHHRMPFAWSARPLASSNFGPSELPIYRFESSKITEEEIMKHLQDLRRPEKQSKWQVIPGTLKINLHPIKADQPLENTVTSSMVPVKPFPTPPTNPPAIEIEEFVPDKGQLCNPFESYVNNLYVYPHSLKFDSQKSFTKARNIACCIEVKDSDDEHAVPLKRIYAQTGASVFTTVGSTAVLHHNQTPEFTEEVKISLPLVLHERHHLLFRFYHVSCEGSKASLKPHGSGKKKDGIEMAVGFAWLPLLHASGRVEVGEKMIPVAVNLPSRYLSHDHHGRSGSSPEIKMVDGGKPIFKLNLHLLSTVYSKDQHLHNFFVHCQKMMSSPSPGTDIDSLNKLKLERVSDVTNNLEQQYLMNTIKSLHAVDVSTFIQFLPTILNQLFKLLAKTSSEDVAINAVRVIIHIVSEVQEADKMEMLERYVNYVFRAEPIPKGSKQKTVHEELAKSLTSILRPANTDQLVVTRFLNNSWFFFEILIKSMTQFLIDGERVKMPRHERFTGDYQYRIQNLLQSLTPYITSKFKEAPTVTKNANYSLAHFVRMCFTLMDRGVVFQFVSQHLQNFNMVDHRTLHEYKFEFLRVVCNHEHYIPLSLPLMRKGLIKTYKDLKCDYTLSEEFRKTHYLTGLLLQELKLALNEQREVRRCAIHVLRDQIAKHAFDDRYTSKSQQGRIAALYLPLISILLDNKHRLTGQEDKSPSAAPPPPVANGDVSTGKGDSKSAGHTPVQKHRSMILLPTPEPAAPKRDSSVFEMIAGTKITSTLGKTSRPYSHLGAEELKSHMGGSSSSLASSTTSSTDTKVESNKDKLIKAHSRQASQTTLAAVGTAAPAPNVYQYQKLDVTEIKDLLICFLHILRYLPDDILLGWFNNSSEYDIIDFFSLLELCLDQFKYRGKKKIVTLSVIGDSSMGRKATTFPSNRSSLASGMSSGSAPNTLRSVSQYGDYPQEHMFHMSTSSEADAMIRALSEANLATEIGLITLDILSVYTEKFKRDLEHRDGDNTLMSTVFDLYLLFLKTSQSETLQKHVFAVWRSFIRKFPTVLFKGNAQLCGNLCYEVLRCCNSRLSSTRKEACALLYNLMKANFEFMKKKSFTRVHLQVIISVAQLIGNVVTLSNSRFQESLALINSYASSDKMMTKSRFPHEVKDLTKRIKTVLMATAQMREHERDPEMLVDLQYSLAKSYASTPELRKTWLDTMAKNHIKYGNYSEAAHCYIHIGALISEYLKKRGSFPAGCTAFRHVSPNIEKEESGIKDDSGMQDVQYSEETLIDIMEQAAHWLDKAERYEVLGDVYKLIIPLYERAREFEKLSQCYNMLSHSYGRVVEVMQSGRRLLGRYFRVAFFGQTYFEYEDQKQYIYKEPKVTSLPELCDRLKALYEGKFGRENVKLITDSNKVDPNDLDPKYAYMQVTHVTPFFREKELKYRLTEFERSNNVNQFMYETPFTKSGKSRGEIHEQFKRRTVLVTSHAFPFVKKRIEVTDRREMILAPIDVAIDEMTNKVTEMREVVELAMPDIKKLQLKLQGSVSAQVNAGPLAYAEAFLSEDKVDKYSQERVEALKNIFRDFISVCNDSLDLNAKLITTEQKEYHESLKSGFTQITTVLSKMFGETGGQEKPDWSEQF